MFTFSKIRRCVLHCISLRSSVTFSLAVFLLTVGVAIDRYVFIRYPFHHSKYFITHRAFFGYVALCCTISTLLILVDVVVTVFFNIVALTLLTTGVTVSIILNIALVRYIQSQAKEIRRLSNTFVHLTNQRKAAKTVTLITMLLVFAFGPMIGFMLAVMSEGLYYWKTPTENSFIFFNWARMLVFLNSGSNALIFISKSKEICQYYNRIFFKK